MRIMEKLSRGIVRLALIAIACANICGCEAIGKAFAPVPEDGPAVEPVWLESGRIRAGVALVIQVGSLAAQPTTMQAIVDQKGEITLPYLLQKPIICDGLTLDALKQKLVKAYSEYIKQPQVTVTFAPSDGRGVSPWGTVTVLGEVVMPGPVNMPSTMDLTVTKVLQAAGGLRPFANKKAIRVSRCDKDGNKTKFTVDLNEIGEKGRIDMDIALRAGDVVWVPETWY